MNRNCVDCPDRHIACQNIKTCETYRQMMLENEKKKKDIETEKMFEIQGKLRARRIAKGEKNE
jgi:hypothetical protein